MSLRLNDLTQVLQETTRRGIGSQRWQRPVYLDFLPPCNHACPAGENIQAWLAQAQAGEYQQAWRTLVQDNPLPATHGRACYHLCESSCNRKDLDFTVEIRAVERFLGDLAAAQGWSAPQAAPSGKKVLIVGSGPAGLSCAWHLARSGHQVEIREAADAPGGMMTYGIPSYRLPRDVLNREIDRIVALRGVTLKCGAPVKDIVAAKAEGCFDAVFVAVGAQVANHLDVPATDGRKMIDALSLLERVKRGERPLLGRAVAVIGGGNVAMDAARTARRLGAQEALIIYRRDREHMKALPDEEHEAQAEGVKIRWLSVAEHFGSDGLNIEKVRLNADGSLTPTGQTERIATDAVVLAVGQHADLSLLSALPAITVTRQGTVQVDPLLMTGAPGIFAGGDCIGGAATMTAATGHGKLAARAIDAWLKGGRYQRPASHRLVTFDMLHLFQYRDAPPNVQPSIPAAERSDFGEVEKSFSEPQARHEAQRCLSCGNCFECDNCYAACPEQAITRLGRGNGYAVAVDLCTGCAACFEQCPCHAIEMTPEPAGATAPLGNLGEPLAPSAFKVRP